MCTWIQYKFALTCSSSLTILSLYEDPIQIGPDVFWFVRWSNTFGFWNGKHIVERKNIGAHVVERIHSDNTAESTRWNACSGT